MSFLRIKHPESGNGMWKHFINGKPAVELMQNNRLALMEMLHCNSFKLNGNDHITCVPYDLVWFNEWFTKSEINELLMLGFKIYNFESHEFYIQADRAQILVPRETIFNKIDITSSFI